MPDSRKRHVNLRTPAGMALLVSEKFVQSEQESVAQRVEAENRVLGGVILCLNRECLCAAGMEFLV